MTTGTLLMTLPSLTRILPHLTQMRNNNQTLLQMTRRSLLSPRRESLRMFLPRMLVKRAVRKSLKLQLNSQLKEHQKMKVLLMQMELNLWREILQKAMDWRKRLKKSLNPR